MELVESSASIRALVGEVPERVQATEAEPIKLWTYKFDIDDFCQYQIIEGNESNC